MLADWLAAQTTTTGTGDLTLSAVTGRPLPSDAFGTGVFLPYSIKAANGDRECGEGHVGSGGTLTRMRVTWTYVSGSLSTNPSGPITLPSGTHTVTFGPNASTLPFHPNVADSGKLASQNNWSAHLTAAQANVSAVPARQRQHAVPYLLNRAGRLTAFSVYNVDINAGTSLMLALYSWGNASGLALPGIQLAHSASNVDLGTTGWASVSVVSQIDLTPGWYFTALLIPESSGSVSRLSGSVGLMTPLGSNGKDAATAMISNTVLTDFTDPFSVDTMYSGNNTPVPAVGLILG